MAKNKYYVVENGFVPGIYDNWEECKKNVDGFKMLNIKVIHLLEEAKEVFGLSYNFFNVSSTSSRIWLNLVKALDTGSGVLKSTPACFNSSNG